MPIRHYLLVVNRFAISWLPLRIFLRAIRDRTPPRRVNDLAYVDVTRQCPSLAPLKTVKNTAEIAAVGLRLSKCVGVKKASCFDIYVS